MSFFSELKRRNVFRVGAAYVVFGWLVIQVVETILPAFGFGDVAIRVTTIIFAIGFIPTLIFAWVFELTPEGLTREADVDRSQSITPQTGKRLDRVVMVALALGLAYFAFDKFVLDPRKEAVQRERVVEQVERARQAGRTEALVESYGDRSIAVLAFKDMSPHGDQEYLSDGIAEELLTLLAKIPELRVISRSSAFSYKGKDIQPAQVAKELNVAHILEGSVRMTADRIRIAAQLIDARSDTLLWSETYDRRLDDVIAIQDDIAAAVVDELRVTLLGEGVPRVPGTIPEAYALYLQARHLNDQLTLEASEESERLLKQSLAIDPGFAPAWQQLGVAYMGQLDVGGSAANASELARDALLHALSLDPDFAGAYASLSRLSRANLDYPAADEFLQQALQLKDNSGRPYSAAASLSRTFGRFEESIDLAEKAIAYDPVSSAEYANLGYSLYYARRFDEAAAAFRKSISLNPERFRAYVYLGRVMLEQGAVKEALEVIQRAPEHPMRVAGLAMVHHALGDEDAADQALMQLMENWGEVMAFQIAETYAFRGDHDAAFQWLDRALETRDPGLSVLLGNPAFDDLTSDDRYRSLVEKLGLLQYWEEMNRQQTGA
jgi:adenylate cyclase